jgi:hypothetical protein
MLDNPNVAPAAQSNLSREETRAIIEVKAAMMELLGPLPAYQRWDVLSNLFSSVTDVRWFKLRQLTERVGYPLNKAADPEAVALAEQRFEFQQNIYRMVREAMLKAMAKSEEVR